MSHSVTCTVDRGVATVTMNRPEKRNAFDDEIVRGLDSIFATVGDDQSVRAVVLTGAGGTFCSGADLEWMRSMIDLNEQENERDARRLAEMLARLDRLDKPTIARVNGHAFGGGVGLICCCDIAVAVETAKFSFSEARLGLAPAVISPFVVAAIGQRHARRLFLTAEVFGARTAKDLSLIHELVPPAGLDAMVDELCGHLLEAGPRAQSACKTLLRALPHLSAEKITDYTAGTIARLRVSKEGQQGLTAFLSKQKPPWTRR